jgi:hypothetical protein
MSRIWIRIISILEIIGGLSGIAFVAWEIVATPTDRHSIVIGAIVFAVYVFSFIAGIALWLERPFGRVASIVVQAIQLPKYISQLIIFMFSFGIDAYVYGMLTNNGQPTFGIEFKFLAFNQFFVNVPDAPSGFGISISACVFLGVLLKFKPKRLSEDALVTGSAPNKRLQRTRLSARIIERWSEGQWHRSPLKPSVGR